MSWRLRLEYFGVVASTHLFGICLLTDHALCARLCGMLKCLLYRLLLYGAGGTWTKIRLYHRSTLEIRAGWMGQRREDLSQRQSTSCLFRHSLLGGVKVLAHSRATNSSPFSRWMACLVGTTLCPTQVGWLVISCHSEEMVQGGAEGYAEEGRKEDSWQNPIPWAKWVGRKECRGANASLHDPHGDCKIKPASSASYASWADDVLLVLSPLRVARWGVGKNHVWPSC